MNPVGLFKGHALSAIPQSPVRAHNIAAHFLESSAGIAGRIGEIKMKSGGADFWGCLVRAADSIKACCRPTGRVRLIVPDELNQMSATEIIHIRKSETTMSSPKHIWGQNHDVAEGVRLVILTTAQTVAEHNELALLNHFQRMHFERRGRNQFVFLDQH